MRGVEHIRHARGELFRVRDGGDGERLAKIVMPGMAKGRPAAPARTGARPAAPAPKLQHATQRALAIAKDATVKLRDAKQRGTPSELELRRDRRASREARSRAGERN